MPVQLHQLEIKLTLKNRKLLKQYIPKIFKREKVSLQSLELIFCSDTFLLDINRQFLNHNYYTDIITFNLADSDSPVAGELYISVDRVKENAALLKTSFKAEIHRVIFHGCLHLCGYCDKTAKEIETIRKKEDFYINDYLLST